MINIGTCIQCGKPISMSSTEKDWWDDKIESTKHRDKEGNVTEEGAHLPRRCKSCRQERKIKRIKENACSTSLRSILIDYETDKIEVDSLISRLEQLVADIEALEALVNGGISEQEKTEAEGEAAST